MQKLVYFDYCACVILIILLISTIFRRMTKGRINRYFLVLLILSMLAVISDIWAVTLDNMGAGNIFLKYIAHTAYLSFHNFKTPLYIAYLIALTDTWHKIGRRRTFILLAAPFVVVLTLLVINLFIPIVFYFDENDTYIRGKYFVLLYCLAVFYIAYGVNHLCRYRKLFSGRRFISLVAIFPLMVLAVVIQYFFPDYLVEMFASSAGLLFISMMVQRPEETIDIDTGLGKASAYRNDIKRTFKNEKPVEIIMINITNFNALRDMLGYDGICEMLHKIANRLVAFNKAQNVKAELYHLGEGKFRFVIDYRYFDKTEECAEAINKAMKHNFRLKQMEVNLITCVCIVRCPEDIEDIDSLIAFGNDIDAKAYTGDVLYASKLYKKEYYDIMKDIDCIIERGISAKKFCVYYQPIYSVNERRFNSAEALLRLHDDKYGFISPEIFIPAAEKNGAIHKIGAFVLDEVCRFISSDEFKELHLDYIEINLSVAQCMQNNLAKEILETLDKYQITSDKINLEITETAASYSQSIMMKNLYELTKAGICFSLDDFGTGYSNMRRIASLPFHFVKLDKSFANAEGTPKMLIVLENTIKMIKDMNMKIVVEGIETEKLVKQFEALQCEYIQGYYYSRPIPKDDFITFIKNSAIQKMEPM